MNLHEKQIQHLENLRPYLDAKGKAKADEAIERARLRNQVASFI